MALIGVSADAAAEAGIDLGSARHLEETAGQSRVWLSVGPQYWPQNPASFDRPLSTQFGLGYAYEVGHARLAWHIRLIEDLKTGRRRFISVDLLSIERVFSIGSFKPYYRLALAAATDLAGPKADFGQAEFHNQENGTTGGFGLRAGAGIDWDFNPNVFTRFDCGWALYGGVGRVSSPFSATLAFGLRL